MKHSHTKRIRRSRRNKNALRSITILYQNIKGLECKYESLQAIIEEQNPSIVCLVETDLADITSEEDEEEEKDEDKLTTLKIRGYEIMRKDRKHIYGGGCIIAYHNDINGPAKVVLLLDQYLNLRAFVDIARPSAPKISGGHNIFLSREGNCMATGTF